MAPVTNMRYGWKLFDACLLRLEGVALIGLKTRMARNGIDGNISKKVNQHLVSKCVMGWLELFFCE